MRDSHCADRSTVPAGGWVSTNFTVACSVDPVISGQVTEGSAGLSR